VELHESVTIMVELIATVPCSVQEISTRQDRNIVICYDSYEPRSWNYFNLPLT